MPFSSVIIIDFDDTLHDTMLLKQQMIEACQNCGICLETFQTTYNQIANQYTFEEHIRLMAHTDMALQKALTLATEPLFSINAFHQRLFPGAKTFLKSLGGVPFENTKKILLSKGSLETQTLKIQACDISSFFDHIFITQNKLQFLQDNPHFQNGFFINDKPAENDDVQATFEDLEVLSFCLNNPENSNFTDFDQLYQYLQFRQTR